MSQPRLPHLAGLSAPPVIVRLAGLAAEALEPLGSTICLERLERSRLQAEALADLQARLVDRLTEAIPQYPPKIRRFLLAVRRCCFNRRPLSHYSLQPDWPVLLEASRGLALEVVELEKKASEHHRALSAVYAAELERERRHLFGLLDDQRFLRGIALGSPELARQARGLRQQADAVNGRRGRKIEQSLLRFATRAAAKLSPYSTLTPIAIGAIRDTTPRSFQFLACDRHERSVLRVNRAFLEQCQELLLRHPQARSACLVALNGTIQESEPDCFRFLRRSRWEIDSETNDFRFVPSSQVRVTLTGILLEKARGALVGGPVAYGSLITQLARSTSNAQDGVRIAIDRLISLGFLLLHPPWPTHETHLENCLLQFLDQRSSEPVLAALAQDVRHLLALEAHFQESRAPELVVKEIEATLVQLLASLRAAVGVGGVETVKLGHVAYEDVLIASTDAAEPEILHLSPQAVDEVLGAAGLLARFAAVYNHRYDLLHTLAAHWASKWRDRREVPALEVFHDFRPIWESFIRFDLHERNSEPIPIFNPLSVSAIDRLDRFRIDLAARAKDLLQNDTEGKQLPVAKFAALLEGVPGPYRPFTGPSVYIQPADQDGSSWVLNRLFDGTGRYISRYGSIMTDGYRRRFADHLTSRSIETIGGQPYFLLDLLVTHGSTTNVHSPQTLKVLEMPGEHIDVPPERRVFLQNLRVQADLPTETFYLVDAQSQRMLPVNLSSLNNIYLPSLLRFLSLFGPFENRQMFPRSAPELLGDVFVCPRLRCGSLVFRRKRWEIAKASLNSEILSGSGVDAFERINRWRAAKALPRQVFLYEQMHQEGSVVQSFKPQLLDFASPSLVSLFLAIANKNGDRLLFEEALPASAAFPLDSGLRRGLEIQIDSIALKDRSELC